MNPQEIQQVAACDEKWVPFAERVKINSTNIRLETTKVPDIVSYEFLLANKKCTVIVEVFRTILDIYPRVEGVDFVDVPDDDTTLTFLINLGYKGPLNKYTNMFVDQMHQPWRTLAAIINKCLSGKLASNDKLKKSRIDILIIPDVHQIFNKSDPTLEKQRQRRVVKKKVTLSANDNIISDDPDVALELAKSISQTEAKEAEAARKVHATHARIVSESVPESAKKKYGGRSPKSIVIQDTSSAPKSKPATSKANLKGAPSLTPAEQEAANIMQALKESKKTSKRLQGTRGLNEGTGTIPRVPDESTVVSATSSEETGAKPGVTDKDKDITEEKDENDGDADNEGDDHVSDTQDANDEDVETKSNEDDIYKYKIRVHKDEDVEMKDAEVEETDKGEEKVTVAAKEEAKKTSEVKDDTKETELPPSSSSLSVSSGFGDQFLKLSSDSSLSPLVEKIPVLVILETTNLPPIPEIVTENLVTNSVPSPLVTPIISSVQQTTTQFPTPIITTDAPNITTAVQESNALISQVLTIVDSYLDTKVGDITNENHKNRSDDDDEDDDDKDPPARPNQGSKIGKSALTKELVEEPIAEVIMNDAGIDVDRNDNPPQETSKPKTRKTMNLDWFKQPLRPPTPDPEWNKRQVVLDQPAQPWFNQIVSALKDPLTFNDLMAHPITSPIHYKLDWNNPERDRYPFDLSKPLPLQGPPGHRTVAADYFFNNDLEYLKTSDLEVTYTTSITKTKAAQYKIKGIEDMIRKFSKQNVYSTKAILGVKSVSVKKLHGYGHLEEIVVKRSDQQLYTFKEGDFIDLHLNDIEDMLLLAVQHKLFHLDGNVIVDFIMALRMFTRSLILKRRVEDLQLGFSDGTLKSVRDEIHHRVLDFRLDYNTEMPKRKWTTVDRKRSGLMIELIDKQLREREIIKYLERLVGARELEMDYKLMTHWYQRHGYREQVQNLNYNHISFSALKVLCATAFQNKMMSSPNHSTSDIKDAFSSMNILNYTSASLDYFPASAGSSSFNISENPQGNMIPPVFLSFYNNHCLKDVQAFYAKELPISPPDPITPPAILTSSPVLPPSLLFDPQYFFVPKELLPKKKIHPSSSTSSNSSRKQDYILDPAIFLNLYSNPTLDI
ncbi:hypothetical protein Tco_0085225 [Tanacetum coccineum]